MLRGPVCIAKGGLTICYRSAPRGNVGIRQVVLDVGQDHPVYHPAALLQTLPGGAIFKFSLSGEMSHE